jgi:four helix bundle protein
MGRPFDFRLIGVTFVTVPGVPSVATSLRVFQQHEEELPMSGTYSDLAVWQGGMDLAIHIYRLTKNFPKEETYGLTSQLRRAAVSVPSNIAEGKGRSSDKDLIHFLDNSRGSLFEIETQAAIARRLGYLSAEQSQTISSQTARVGQLLNGLIRALRQAA